MKDKLKCSVAKVRLGLDFVISYNFEHNSKYMGTNMDYYGDWKGDMQVYLFNIIGAHFC